MYNFTPFSYNTRAVTNISEAKNAPIDISGNPVFYFNSVSNEIYMKQFDLKTGNTFLGTYKFVAEPVEEQPKDELKLINEKLDYLYKLCTEKDVKPKKEKAVKDDE